MPKFRTQASYLSISNFSYQDGGEEGVGTSVDTSGFVTLYLSGTSEGTGWNVN